MRLMYRKFHQEDFSQYYQLVSNEMVMVKITERSIPLEEAKERFEKILKKNQQHKIGGSFKVIEETTNSFFGLAHLTVNPSVTTEAEIGYMLLPEYWGQGIGSSVMTDLLKKAEEAKLEKLIAVIDPENNASRKILLNTGFISTFIGELDGLSTEILEKNLASEQ